MDIIGFEITVQYWHSDVRSKDTSEYTASTVDAYLASNSVSEHAWLL